MKKKSFTLVEILVVVTIVGILATIAIPNYLNIIENSKAKVCELNLKALQIALDNYMMEHDIVPANLSQLPYQYIKEAYTRILEQKGAWKIKMAYFVVDWQRRGLAYAEPFIKDLARGDAKLLICPADPDPVKHGGISYGINSALAGKTAREYRELANDAALIGDSDQPVFENEGSLSGRHKEYKILQPSEHYAKVIRRDKKISRILRASTGKASSISPSQKSASASAFSQGKKDTTSLSNKDFEKRPQ